MEVAIVTPEQIKQLAQVESKHVVADPITLKDGRFALPAQCKHCGCWEAFKSVLADSPVETISVDDVQLRTLAPPE